MATKGLSISFLFLILSICIEFVCAGAGVELDYLNSIMARAKLQPRVNDEMNFSPNVNEFSNVVMGVPGRKGKKSPFVRVHNNKIATPLHS